MGSITILPETTKNPITLIGERAGVCKNSDITNKEKNYKRGMDCILSNHGRTLEFVNIEMIIDGYSARVIREYYTHIGCLPTRLQESTRYIDYTKDNGFNYVIPWSIQGNTEALVKYVACMENINNICAELENELSIPKEDASMLIPLGMTTKIVDKRNLRNLLDMCHQRMCGRAYWEYRQLMHDICDELSKISDEWKWIIENLFVPKCEQIGYCPEKKSCGRKERLTINL